MREIQEILKKKSQFSPDEKAVLATVVDVQGSSYRLPGAKMLICETGETYGTVSGGCLEADVLERAKKVLQTNKPEIFVYDTTTNDDSIFALNMGCRGVIRILLEPLSTTNELAAFWQNCFEKRGRGAIATLISTTTEKSYLVGLIRIFIREEQTGVLLGSNYPPELAGDCLDAINKGISQSKSYGTADGADEFFIDVVKPPLNFLIFGAGVDAVPLVEAAKNLGWRATVIDHRAAFAAGERFPAADEIIITRPENLAGKLTIDKNTVAVVMTHNYEHDKNILKFLLNSNAPYVGALGPKRRAENILREWRAAGEDFSGEQLNKLYAPVGLDIGADTPEAIALSIVAEIQSVSANRSGGFLRERKGSIYNRDADD
ncbi:MAG: XdhC family protein [Acidobacteriota bacterium]|nr:XdhC family protein [Acidobacteriota bacterium]